MNKWEYKIITLGEDGVSYSNLEEILNRFGEDGWEIVGTLSPSYVPGGSNFKGRFFLKRQKS